MRKSEVAARQFQQLVAAKSTATQRSAAPAAVAPRAQAQQPSAGSVR
jgi:hypothetical protein